MDNNKIYGNWATLLLPFNDDETIDYLLFAKEIDYLIACNVDGIYSNGTAGEFISLSEDEFKSTTAIFATKCFQANIPFQIGCSHPSAQTSLERIRFAREFNPTAIQVILPEWFPITNAEAIKFLKKAIETSNGIPLTLYNPPHAKRQLNYLDFEEILTAVPKVESIKVCDGDETWYQNMAKVMKMTAVFVPGHHLATGVKFGAKGAYSNVACISPTKAQAWYDLMIADLEKALEEEENIRNFMDTYIAPMIAVEKHANFTIDKFLATVGGYLPLTNVARFPYQRVDPSRKLYIRQKLKETAPYFVDSAIE